VHSDFDMTLCQFGFLFSGPKSKYGPESTSQMTHIDDYYPGLVSVFCLGNVAIGGGKFSSRCVPVTEFVDLSHIGQEFKLDLRDKRDLMNAYSPDVWSPKAKFHVTNIGAC